MEQIDRLVSNTSAAKNVNVTTCKASCRYFLVLNKEDKDLLAIAITILTHSKILYKQNNEKISN